VCFFVSVLKTKNKRFLKQCCKIVESSATNCNAVEPAAQQQSSRRLPDPDRESMSYELQQGYRILRELMTDSNKSFVGPFLNAVDTTAVGCADYYERIKRPMWMKRSKYFVCLHGRHLQFCTQKMIDKFQSS
jgi:hypothetical protein